ncbi:TapB family protein [Sphingobacterium faecale]|uniref:DUF3108 domain-containing protein n=1 Tax=Sphingobacterium faecale TaxID=2803775 RepID=A0ABS1QZU9_9SPHI|nr:hypothetical protein [Sphingobacterium faecale]MBL1407849.1 hypothetical protein [Sphingobacterium faecale]
MKNILITSSMLLYLLMGGATVKGQVLKGFGQKLEKKIEQRIERKADRQVDKVLDKADKKSDESIEGAFSKSKTEASDKKPGKTEPIGSVITTVEARPDQALVLVGNGCTDFSWFKKGTVLIYQSTDDKGREDAELKMTINDLKTKGTATIAEVKADMTTPHFGALSYTMNYICDGDMIYMDIASMMQAMMENNPEMKTEAVQNVLKNTTIDVDKGFASFPKKMYPGMKLEDLNFSFKTKAGSNEMSFQTVVTDRQVVGKELVTTKAGSFECLKVKSSINTSVKVMGMNKKMPASTEYLWFAPKIGMIKQESHAKTGKTAMELKMYKM